MTDHLAEARAAIHAEHGWSMAAPASSLADMASAVAHILDHLEAAQTPDADRYDRIDRLGDRRVWCDECDRLRMSARHDYGPLAFAHRPADTPATAPQPDEAHGGAPDPARPADPQPVPKGPSMSDDDPTTDDMCEQYVAGAMVTGFTYSRREAREDFDRWLAAHDTELREQIAAEIEADPKSTFLAGRAETSLTSHELAIWSGMRRAARVARGEKP